MIVLSSVSFFEVSWLNFFIKSCHKAFHEVFAGTLNKSPCFSYASTQVYRSFSFANAKFKIQLATLKFFGFIELFPLVREKKDYFCDNCYA